MKHLKRFNENLSNDINWTEVESNWYDWYEDSFGEADYDDEFDAMKSFINVNVNWSKVGQEYFDYIEETNNEDDYDRKFLKFKSMVKRNLI